MIITKTYAKKLVKAGKARIEGYLTELDGEQYMIVTRFDLQRTDHYLI